MTRERHCEFATVAVVYTDLSIAKKEQEEERQVKSDAKTMVHGVASTTDCVTSTAFETRYLHGPRDIDG